MNMFWYIVLFLLFALMSLFGVKLPGKRTACTVLFFLCGVMWILIRNMDIDPEKHVMFTFLFFAMIPMLVVWLLGDGVFLSGIAFGIQVTGIVTLALFAFGLIPYDVFCDVTYVVSRIVSSAWGLLFAPLFLMVFGLTYIFGKSNGDF